MRVLIIGAGEHAQVVADILLQQQEQKGLIRPLGYVDDRVPLHGQFLLGLPVLGSLNQLKSIPHDGVVVGIGNNAARARLFTWLREQHETIVSAIHPSAVVSRHAQLGVGVMICAGAVVNPATIIGDNVIINTSASVDHHNRIAAHVHIAPGSHLGGNVCVETGTLVGIGATVILGVTIGEWAVIGAGAVVTEDMPGWATCVGVPARVIKRRDAREKIAA